MRELTAIDTYHEFKEALGNELKSQAQGFVRTGYLLKVARDTDILQESGYSSVAEFAKAEYGLVKDTVSRYIAINDKYSESGYSDRLEEKYRDFGIAKLQEMLTLPEPVTDLLTPEISKRQLQKLKKEIREEEQITDLEVMMEESQEEQKEMILLERMLYWYFHENKIDYVKLSERMEAIRELQTTAPKIQRAVEEILNVLAQSGHNILSARIPGEGKMLLSIHGADNMMELLNVRSGEKEEISWEELHGVLEKFMLTNSGRAGWEEFYGETFEEKSTEEPIEPEEKSKVAPVQPEQEMAAVDKETEAVSQKEFLSESETVEETAAVEKERETVSQKEVLSEPETETVAVIEETDTIKEHIEALKEIMMDDLEQLKSNIDKEEWDLVQLGANNIAAYAEELEELEEL